jgi:polyhydroxybutyrate depolymerase
MGVSQTPDGSTQDVVEDSGPSELIPTRPGVYSIVLGARSFVLQIPSGYDGTTGASVLVVLHALGDSAQAAFDASGFREQAEANGWIAVYPQATLVPNIVGGSFNGFYCCGPAHTRAVDDVMFVRMLLTRLQQSLQINGNRVYAVGFDNGAMLAHRLGVEAPDVFAAIAAIGGSVTGRESAETAPVIPPISARTPSVLIVHGRLDTQVPYGGGLGVGGAVHGGVDDSVRYWSGAMGCSPNASLTVIEQGLVQSTQRGCGRRLELTTLSAVEGAHSWRVLEPHRVSTAQSVVQFLQRNARD